MIFGENCVPGQPMCVAGAADSDASAETPTGSSHAPPKTAPIEKDARHRKSDNLHKDTKKADWAFKSIGPVQCQAKVIHNYATKHAPGVGRILGLSDDPKRSKLVSQIVMKEIEASIKTTKGLHSNDAMTSKEAFFIWMAPVKPEHGADPEVMREWKFQMNAIVRHFKLKGATKRQFCKASARKRAMKYKDNKKISVNKHYWKETLSSIHKEATKQTTIQKT